MSKPETPCLPKCVCECGFEKQVRIHGNPKTRHNFKAKFHASNCRAGCSDPLPNPIDEANAPKAEAPPAPKCDHNWGPAYIPDGPEICVKCEILKPATPAPVIEPPACTDGTCTHMEHLMNLPAFPFVCDPKMPPGEAVLTDGKNSVRITNVSQPHKCENPSECYDCLRLPVSEPTIDFVEAQRWCDEQIRMRANPRKYITAELDVNLARAYLALTAQNATQAQELERLRDLIVRYVERYPYAREVDPAEIGYWLAKEGDTINSARAAREAGKS